MENNREEELRTSPSYKSRKLAENWNRDKLGGKGNIVRKQLTSVLFPGKVFKPTWHVEYKAEDRREWIEKYEKYVRQQGAHCMGCNKVDILKKVGACPMFCGDCYKLYRKENKKLAEIRELKGWRPLNS